MLFSISSRALLQGVMASALVLAGTTACSPSDRSETGSDNSAVIRDTLTTTPGTGTATGTGFDSDTVGLTGAALESGAATGDTVPAKLQQDAPRAATAAPSAESEDTSLEGDSAAAGYRPMQPDTLTVPESDSARVTEDTSEISVADPSPTEMARDTTTTADQVDTTGAAIAGEVAVETSADTAWTETAGDTGTTAWQADTTEAGVSGNITVGAVETTDSAGPIRSPEDSTELIGEVTTNTTGEVAVADTVESDRIRPPEDSTELYGNAISDETADEREYEAGEREVVSASEGRTEEVGAAAIAGTVTGAEAVALLTRQGASCIVVDPESNDAVRWDMSRTPVTLNPCGLGSMNLSKVRTAGSGLQE